jgi:hypothetical protein
MGRYGWDDLAHHYDVLKGLVDTLLEKGTHEMSVGWEEGRAYTEVRTIDSHVRTACQKTFEVAA